MEEVTMVEVSGARVRQAFVVFKQAYGSGWREARGPFKELVYVEDFNRYRFLLTEQEAERVEKMNGPHGYAYCKILLANRPKVPWT